MIKTNLLVVTPIYPPASGGGAQYTKCIVEELAHYDSISNINVLTEGYPDSNFHDILNSKSHVWRLFPYRAGKSKITFSSYVKYLILQIKLFTLFHWVKRERINVILLHSSFLIHAGSLSFIVWCIKKIYKNDIKVILDIRDIFLPLSVYKRLYIYDSIICCSKRIEDLIISKTLEDIDIHVCPMPIKISKPNVNEVDKTCSLYGINKNKYLFFPNGISSRKDFHIAYEIWVELLERGHEFDLVVCGRNRSWKKKYDKKYANGSLHYIGSISNKEVLCLQKGSAIVLNTCRSESPSRTSVESMILEAKVLLPPYVPEFSDIDDKLVASSKDCKHLADKVENILLNNLFPDKYNYHVHDPGIVCKGYEKIFNL